MDRPRKIQKEPAREKLAGLCLRHKIETKKVIPVKP